MQRYVVIALLLTAVWPARAATYEVGSPDEFNARAEKLQPGDELVVRDGVYRDCRLTIPSSGAEGSPVIIRPASPGGVLLRRATQIVISGDYNELRDFHFEHCGPAIVVLIDGGDFNRVTACRFLHCGDPRSTYRHIIEVGQNAHHNRVDHCYFEGSKSMSLGLRIRSKETLGLHNRFDHNVFRDIFRLSSNGQEAIQIGQGGPSDQFEAHALVEYNTFDNASGDAEFISNKASRNTYRYNVAANCNASLVLRGGNQCLVEGNVLARNSTGLRVHGTRHTIINNLFLENTKYGITMPLGGEGHRQPDDCLVANNTFVNNGRAGLAFAPMSSYTLLPKNNRIVNNVFVGSTGLLLDQGEAIENEVAHNLFWPGDEAEVGFAGQDAIQYDPLLVGTGISLHLSAGSPAVDAALRLPEVVRDRLGNPRPLGKAPDLGADEYSPRAPSAAAVALPLVPPPRPPFDAEALKGDPLFGYDVDAPTHGWRSAGSASAAAENGILKLTEAAIWFERELPADFILEWEYSPGSLSAQASVTFGAGGRAGGYTLGFGGTRGEAPGGVVTLAKGSRDHIVADGHDTVIHRDFNKPLPNPKLWYRCRLVKLGGDLRFEIRGTPIVLCSDTGVVGGPALGAGALGISQTGSGAWRNLQAWRYTE